MKKGKIFLRKFNYTIDRFEEIETDADSIIFYTHENDYIDVRFKDYNLYLEGFGQLRIVPHSANSYCSAISGICETITIKQEET